MRARDPARRVKEPSPDPGDVGAGWAPRAVEGAGPAAHAAWGPGCRGGCRCRQAVRPLLPARERLSPWRSAVCPGLDVRSAFITRPPKDLLWHHVVADTSKAAETPVGRFCVGISFQLLWVNA